MPACLPTEHYVDRSTYAFSHGPSLLAVLTAGAPPGSAASPAERYPGGYLMTNLTHMAGQELCDALLSGVRALLCASMRALLRPSCSLCSGFSLVPGWRLRLRCDPSCARSTACAWLPTAPHACCPPRPTSRWSWCQGAG